MHAIQSNSLVREVEIASRFIGPDGIVNGGYLAGVLERDVGGPSEIALLRPTPPDRRLSLHAPAASVLELRDGNVVLAVARAVSAGIDAPEPVSFEDAAAAADESSFDDHPFPRCFVCGPERSATDALRVFSGVIAPGRVAAPVRFSRALADDDGVVRREYVTAALDCPGGWAIASEAPAPMLLARFVIRHESVVRADERCVVVARATGVDGRKRTAVTALYGEDGTLRACAEALWIKGRDQ